MRFAPSLVLVPLAALAASAPAATVIVVPDFTGVELRSGGRVFVRHGPAQRVELVSGDRGEVDVAVRDGRLVIVNCVHRCRDRHDLRVEIVMPRLDAASVESGGSIQVRAGFPDQGAVALQVSNGGAVDARGIEARHVTAAVAHGGMILTRPGEGLDASVSQGGIITYWGEPAVRRSIRRGGAIERGREGDSGRPLADLTPHPPNIPPLPPVPPLPNGGD